MHYPPRRVNNQGNRVRKIKPPLQSFKIDCYYQKSTANSQSMASNLLATAVAEVRNTLQWFRHREYKLSDAKVIEQNAMKLFNYSSLRNGWDKESTAKLERTFEEGKFANCLRDFWVFAKAKKKQGMDMDAAFNKFVSATINLTDASATLSRSVVRQGVVQLILSDIQSTEFQQVHEKQDNDIILLAKRYIVVLHNILNVHGVSECRDLIRAAGGAKLFRVFTMINLDSLKIDTVFLLAAVMTDDEKREKTEIFSKSTIDLIHIHLLSAFSDRKNSTYSSTELLAVIALVANFDETFAQMLLNETGLKLITIIIRAPNNAPESQSTNSIVDYSTIEEKILTLKCLWSCCFYEASRNAIKSMPEIMSQLQEMLSSRSSADLAALASGILWEIRKSSPAQVETQPLAAPNTEDASTGIATGSVQGDKSDQDVKHVMISYSWDNQDQVLAIHEHLETEGIRCWIDKTDMKGSTIEAMASAVQNAKVVIICYSEAYFRSPNCRAEAEYAYQRRKRIVPVRMEKYTPESWLGFILGAAFYFDFCDPQLFNDCAKRLAESVRKLLAETSVPIADSRSVQSVTRTSTTRAGVLPAIQSTGRHLNQLTEKNIEKWLEDSDLAELKPKLQKVDGKCLREMLLLETKAPQFFFEQLKEHLQVDIITLMRFMAALRKLSESHHRVRKEDTGDD